MATFSPLRPYFLAVSAILLARGFYFAYRKPKACVGETCALESGTRRLAKPLLWLVILAVAALVFFLSYGVKINRKICCSDGNIFSNSPNRAVEDHWHGLCGLLCSDSAKAARNVGSCEGRSAVFCRLGNGAIQPFANRYQQSDRSCERFGVQGRGFQFCTRVNRCP